MFLLISISHTKKRRNKKQREGVVDSSRKLSKNKKQRERVADEGNYFELLKQILLKMNLKETPKRGFTKVIKNSF